MNMQYPLLCFPLGLHGVAEAAFIGDLLSNRLYFTQ